MVVSVGLESVEVALAVGGAAAAALGTGTALFSQRSTDRAEARYRTDLVEVFEAALNDHSNDHSSGSKPVLGLDGVAIKETVGDSSKTDTQARLAALPVEYHAQVLAQSRASFFFSIGAAVVGFAILAVAIVVILTGNVAPGLATMVAAAITETVPALFFTQSNRARKMMADQLDGFRADAETQRAARERRELIEMVQDPTSRDALIAQTVARLTGPVHGPAPDA